LFPLLLQGSDAPSLLKERLRLQLVRVAAAYKHCLLFLEGSAAFELTVMSCVDELIALGRRCHLALSIITAISPTALEVTSLTQYLCIPSLLAHLLGLTASQFKTPYQPFSA
jgi:hypothetical protein